jgi:hypothetical protein
MSKPAETAERRRAFLKSLVRYPLLAGTGLAAGWLTAKRGPLSPEETCVNRGHCRGCTVLGDCGLPQGRLARQAMGRK